MLLSSCLTNSHQLLLVTVDYQACIAENKAGAAVLSVITEYEAAHPSVEKHMWCNARSAFV
jgi:hypothetical protein